MNSEPAVLAGGMIDMKLAAELFLNHQGSDGQLLVIGAWLAVMGKADEDLRTLPFAMDENLAFFAALLLVSAYRLGAVDHHIEKKLVDEARCTGKRGVVAVEVQLQISGIFPGGSGDDRRLLQGRLISTMASLS